MKSIAVVLIIVLDFTVSLTQRNQQKFSIGVHTSLTAGKILNATRSIITDSAPPFPSPFRFSYGIGIAIQARLSKSIYLPINIDFINRRYAIGTNDFFSVLNPKGYYDYIKPKYYEYKINELVSLVGIGYRINKKFAFELCPFIQVALNDQKVKIDGLFDWKEDANDEHLYDYGIAMGFRYDLAKWYIRFNYQYGLNSDDSFRNRDNKYNPESKPPTHNLTMLSFGYKLLNKF